MQRAPFSSLGYSIAAYQPNYAVPIDTDRTVLAGGWAGAMELNPPASTNRQGAPVVNRKPRQGLRHLYSHGSQAQTFFPMVCTGQVQSSRFQRFMTSLVVADFNDRLYEAGYPRNLGLSVKVATVPNELLDNTVGPRMNAQPQQRRVIFTRRAFSTAPSIPAKPSNS